MKRTQLALTLFSAAAFAVNVGCKRESEVTSGGETIRDVPRETAKKETKAAAEAIMDYAYAQRAEYAAKTREELAELNHELDELSAKVARSSATAQAEAKVKLQQLRDKVARLGEKVDGLQNATESTWDDVKAGVKQGYDDVKESFREARAWFSEKIAP